MTTWNSNLKRVELLLFLSGVVLTGVAVFQYLGGRIYSRGAIARFHADPPSQVMGERTGLGSATQVDYSLWSPKRVEEYKASLAGHFDQPLALLRVERIRLEVPVFEGTSDLVLNRGVGRIAGTARIGEAGNIGIAGHRDGFFRGLKDVNVGDTMELETVAGIQIYAIDFIAVVERDDTSVLRNKSFPELTLVTCFPFYFVGRAPKRYIVRAVLRREIRTTNESEKASSQATASRAKGVTQ
ncbi:MAG: class D sortase [Acidobacteriota bacterium]